MSALEQPFPDIDRILPHRGPSRFVIEAIRADRDSAVCRARVPAANALVTDGHAPAFLGIEVAAQAAALHSGMVRVEDGETEAEPRVGYLTGVREATCHRPTFRSDADVEVQVVITHFAVPISMHRFEMKQDGQTIITGSISTYVP
ncbi:MAG: hypothetical protein RL885_20945 [Planctomycetota bacterium]